MTQRSDAVFDGTLSPPTKLSKKHLKLSESFALAHTTNSTVPDEGCEGLLYIVLKDKSFRNIYMLQRSSQPDNLTR